MGGRKFGHSCLLVEERGESSLFDHRVRGVGCKRRGRAVTPDRAASPLDWTTDECPPAARVRQVVALPSCCCSDSARSRCFWMTGLAFSIKALSSAFWVSSWPFCARSSTALWMVTS